MNSDINQAVVDTIIKLKHEFKNALCGKCLLGQEEILTRKEIESILDGAYINSTASHYIEP